MYSSTVIPSEHKDLIHDVAFNWYGTQLATCSSDQTLRIWSVDQSTQEWHCTAAWKCHSGAVWKINWAHPEFGQVLATCSFDRTAAIWEEMPGDESSIPGTGGAAVSTFAKFNPPPPPASSVNEHEPAAATSLKTHWVKRSSLVDSRTSVTDVKFAPKRMGLILATCSGDGTVRIYEAADVMNLGQWSLQHEIQCKTQASCLSWNHSLSKSQPPMLAVGSDDTSAILTEKVMIYEYSDTNRRWLKMDAISFMSDPVHDIAFAPNIGRSYSVLAVASKELKIVTLKPNKGSQNLQKSSDKYDIRLAGYFNDHASTVWRVCWNATGTIVASSGDDGQVRLWKSNYMDNWKCVASLRGDGMGGRMENVTFSSSSGLRLPSAALGLAQQQHQMVMGVGAGNRGNSFF